MPCETATIRLGRALPAICGAVAEWSKALAWKVSMGQKLIEGSNPSRSATDPYCGPAKYLRLACYLGEETNRGIE